MTLVWPILKVANWKKKKSVKLSSSYSFLRIFTLRSKIQTMAGSEFRRWINESFSHWIAEQQEKRGIKKKGKENSNPKDFYLSWEKHFLNKLQLFIALCCMTLRTYSLCTQESRNMPWNILQHLMRKWRANSSLYYSVNISVFQWALWKPAVTDLPLSWIQIFSYKLCILHFKEVW